MENSLIIISPEEEVASALVKQWRTPGALILADFSSSLQYNRILCNEDCLFSPLRQLIDLFPDKCNGNAIIRDTNLIVPRSGMMF